MLRTEKTFCRLCPAHCGMILTLDENDRIVRLKGDKDNPLSKGYVCFKGLQAEDAHHGPARLLHALKKKPDGSFERIGVEQALDEIAEIVKPIIETDGPTAVAGFMGTGTWVTSAAFHMLPAFMRAIGSPSFFSTGTVDQSAKYVTVERLGAWLAGLPTLEYSEVAMVFGSNPLVSHSTVGFLAADPTRALKKAKGRGLRLVVIDPRFTETARYAEIALQPYPGEDPTIAAGMLRHILENGWEDKEFCATYVKPGGIERLRKAVKPFTPDYVAQRAGIPEDKFLEAVELFALGSKKGAVWSATGPSMSPKGNTAEHLIQTINVVCGRFRRAGDRIPDFVPWLPRQPNRAEVRAPSRCWDKFPASRIRGGGNLWGENMTCNLADEILTPGKGQIKVMLNGSANLVASLPDQRKVIKALKALELLVTIEPYMTQTAKLSHYIFAPKLQYERADFPMAPYNSCFFGLPYAAYSPPIIKVPEGSELIDDAYFWWGLASRLGYPIEYNGVTLDMDTPPTNDSLNALIARDSIVPFDEIRKHPSGYVFDRELYAQPADPETAGTFDVMPDDVAAEVEAVFREHVEHGRFKSNGQVFSHRLAVRRRADVLNSQIHTSLAEKKTYPYNPAWLHPDDLAQNNLRSGDRVEIVSDHGRIPAIVESDPTVRPGVVQVSHSWSSEAGGACTNLLISTDRDVEPINSMARLSAIPVNIVPSNWPGIDRS